VRDAQIEAFLTREARLMDEGRYREWLELWTEDAQYWVPCNDDDIDPARQVSIIYDDRDRLTQRVDRLLSGSVLSQQPRPRMRRVVSNIEIGTPAGGEVTVESNFILGLARSGTKHVWIGRSIHQLRETGDSLKIARKKVLLIDNDQEIPLLQFLI
jgi:3-phenylpropionate/cinnamic acid dioxygenase small subunit